jgi:hypothetical protein
MTRSALFDQRRRQEDDRDNFAAQNAQGTIFTLGNQMRNVSTHPTFKIRRKKTIFPECSLKYSQQ